MEVVKDISTILGLIISISSVLGIFTAIVNKSFAKKLKPIENRLSQDEQESMRNQMNNLRYRVVTFANDLHRGIEHSRYEYSIIFQFVNDYEECIEKLGLTNHLFDEEVAFIEKCYRELNKD